MTARRKLDDELEHLLGDAGGGEFGAIYRRLPRAEPPRRIDRNVLAEAARAVHGRPPRRQRWQLALGSAAGIVLVAGIAWHVGHDALQVPMPPARSRPELVPVQPLDRASAARRQDQARERGIPAAPPLPSAASPAAADNRAAKAETSPAATETAKGDREKARTRETAERETETPPRSTDAAADAASVARRSSKSEPSQEARERSVPPMTPATWIEHIRSLLREGRGDDAAASLRALRRAYPQAPLPADLRALER